MTVNIVALAGSTRKDSLNKMILQYSAKVAEDLGAKVDFVDLKDLDLPIYDGDLEESSGIPEKALELKKKLNAADGVLISSPEYNSSYSAALKNAIDWASRPADGEPPLAAFANKVAGIMSASPGPLGGLRGLLNLRLLLGNIRMLVVPSQIAVHATDDLFDAGKITNERYASGLERVAQEVVEYCEKLQSA